ncbi:D(2) dopamine receptor-like [Dendronephthya gigantea]|uniref:D(2) dopamine receptor-like n=1 Tax=Dendronephthya gigantea TaxID=151771 RepID=UPI00106B9F64|nr:D(2) dopamine receptor-like [Dendronephthya gigantea]
MTLSTNATGMYNQSANGTRVAECVPRTLCEWTSNDWMKIAQFEEKRALAEKVIYIVIIIFTILGNTLVLVATWRERDLHQPNKYFIACLALADLLVGVFVVPLRLYKLYLTNETQASISIHLHRFMVWIDTSVITASIYTLTIISFDRYLKISKPLLYRSRITTSVSLKIIFVICIFSSSLATYVTVPRSGSDATQLSASIQKQVKETQTILAIVSFFVPTIIMLIMYVLIFTVAHKRQKRLRNGGLGETFNVLDQRTAFRQDLKVIRMLFLVVGLFIICWGPFFIWWLLYLYYRRFIDYDNTSLSYWFRLRKIQTAIVILPLFNSLCNPMIYAWLDQTYRKAFKHLFHQLVCRENPRVQQHGDPNTIQLQLPGNR